MIIPFTITKVLSIFFLSTKSVECTRLKAQYKSEDLISNNDETFSQPPMRTDICIISNRNALY